MIDEVQIKINKDHRERIESLELYRTSIHDWIKAGLFKPLKGLRDIVEKPKDSEIQLENCPICGENYFLGKCSHNAVTLINKIESLKSQAKQWVNRNFELSNEVDRLKSELVVWVDAESERTNALMRTNKIISQAREHTKETINSLKIYKGKAISSSFHNLIMKITEYEEILKEGSS